MSGDRFALWWVDRYTRGLPDDVRAERRAEITSDVWEHRSALGAGRATGVAILSRCARGILADLSWRRAQRSGRRLPSMRAVAKAVGWALGTVSYLFLVGQFTWGATAVVGLDLYGADWAPGDVEEFSRICVLLLVLLLGGVAAIPTHPRGAVVVLIPALVAIPVVFWWAAPIYVPMGVAVGAAATVLARRTRTRQARAISATS